MKRASTFQNFLPQKIFFKTKQPNENKNKTFAFFKIFCFIGAGIKLS